MIPYFGGEIVPDIERTATMPASFKTDTICSAYSAASLSPIEATVIRVPDSLRRDWSKISRCFVVSP